MQETEIETNRFKIPMKNEYDNRLFSMKIEFRTSKHLLYAFQFYWNVCTAHIWVCVCL